MSDRCPRCESKSPELHPVVQCGGEVQPCPDPWHDSARNTAAGVWRCTVCNAERRIVERPSSPCLYCGRTSWCKPFKQDAVTTSEMERLTDKIVNGRLRLRAEIDRDRLATRHQLSVGGESALREALVLVDTLAETCLKLLARMEDE